MTALRLVLDTHVLLSALLFPGGSLSWLRKAWQLETPLPLASHDTTLELIRVLSYPKFRLTDQEQEDLLADYLPWCETVAVSQPPAVPHAGTPLISLSLSRRWWAQADALVTGDDDLLALAPAFSVPILTPIAIRDRLNETWPEQDLVS